MTEDKQEFLEAVFPAYAGVNLWGNGYSVAWRGIPRVCGGEPNGGHFTAVPQEYSPRMRG